MICTTVPQKRFIKMILKNDPHNWSIQMIHQMIHQMIFNCSKSCTKIIHQMNHTTVPQKWSIKWLKKMINQMIYQMIYQMIHKNNPQIINKNHGAPLEISWFMRLTLLVWITISSINEPAQLPNATGIAGHI